MSFRNIFPDYETFDESDFYMSSIPAGICSALEGFITKYCENAAKLKSVCHLLAAHVPCELTSNWGWSFLIEDLSVLLHRLGAGKFYKLMDCLEDFAGKYLDDDGFEELNDLLEEYEFGYRLRREPFCGSTWELAAEISHRTASIEAAREELRDSFGMAFEHLGQAIEHLKKADTDRSRKDAVRDCMSAMESMMKSLSSQADIKDATSRLKSEGCWGPPEIVKDGLSIWNRLHDLYPDVRHGQPSATPLTEEEALYWTDRITTFMGYISRRKKALRK